MPKLTNEEAEKIIITLKLLVEDHIFFPKLGEKQDLSIIHQYNEESQKFIYQMQINRKTSKRNPLKCTFIIISKIHGVNLLRLDVGGPPHRNPDGEIINDNHLHIYREEYDGDTIPYAVKFDLASEDLIENCLRFLQKFSVVEMPRIEEQEALFH